MSGWSSSICKALQYLEDVPPDSLPLYDEESVHRTRDLVQAITHAAEDSGTPGRRIVLEQFADKLNEGVQLYHRARLLRIMRLQSEGRGQLSPQIRKALAPHEVEFLNSYTQAIASYKKAIGFDLTAPYRPPQGLNAEVTVLRDTGSILAGSSYISLKKNDILTLRTNVAQELEQLGFVQITEYLK
jgi:hypothetical protein